jgi:hypothetical protein
VDPGRLLQEISPHARVATAVLPLLIATAIRLFAGKSRTTGWLLTLALVWLVINVLMAPYSPSTRQDIHNLLRLFL